MLTLDLNAAISGAATAGIAEEELESLREPVARCLEGLGPGGPWTGWVDLPLDEAPALEASAYAASLPAGVRTAAVLGIGGSSLGPQALYHASRHPFLERAGRRTLAFLDNSDPDTVGAWLDELDPAASLFVAITKSGSTAETASQLMCAWHGARAALGEAAREHFVFITDPAKGDLRVLASRLGVRTFAVPPDVGGRFSVLSPVGLVPAAVAGIDPAELLAGARQVRDACLSPDLGANPAAMLAALAHLLDVHHGRRIHVVMSYSDRLALVGAWFRQLWAESLGKRRADGTRVGPTPLDARGATDQHSLLQLLAEGPSDKLVVFLDVRERRHLAVPRVFEDLGSFGYLAGRTLGELISAERRGTEMSLARAGTPSVTITLEDASPRSVGALMYMLEVATAVAGSLYGVDPYDQPGVEEGKRLASGLLGRSGYESKRTEVDAFDAARRPDLLIEA
jgi:glucose-6-phosphate isomerase